MTCKSTSPAPAHFYKNGQQVMTPDGPGTVVMHYSDSGNYLVKLVSSGKRRSNETMNQYCFRTRELYKQNELRAHCPISTPPKKKVSSDNRQEPGIYGRQN